MIYTGIGSRKTSEDDCARITSLAMSLSFMGWTLRSGGADGADAAFELGANEKEIYLPWKRFNRNTSPLFEVTDEAIERSLEFHPAAGRLTPAVRKIMGRNLYQVLGKDLQTPSRFVVCWTPFPTEHAFDSSKAIGGTGQALRIAKHYGIPIYNMREPDAIQRLEGDLPCLASSERPPTPTP